MKVKYNLYRTKKRFKRLCQDYRRSVPFVALIILIFMIYLFSILSNNTEHIYHHKEGISFEGGRILGNPKVIYERKEQVLSKKIQKIGEEMEFLKGELKQLKDQKVKEVKSRLIERLQDGSHPEEEKSLSKGEATSQEGRGEKDSLLREKGVKGRQSEAKRGEGREGNKARYQDQRQWQSQNQNQIQGYQGIKPIGSGPMGSTGFTGSTGAGGATGFVGGSGIVLKRRQFRHRASGPSVISFPVQVQKGKNKKLGEMMTVKIPSGSYVKTKLLTGVEAAEGRAIPVLLQADFAFVGPNKTKIDLSGCFLIAKSTGNLSIERVEMQATKISCVSRSGRMFERSLNGFVADAKDTSFGIIGKVNSKQGRVASMAFLSSIVGGVGNAIKQAQTTTQTNAFSGGSGSSSVITGSQAKYMAAGGASSAASLVTNWYLRHAQKLLPTINVGSGQDVWIVLQNTVDLPNWYFRKQKQKRKGRGKGNGNSSYSFLTRLTD